LTQDYSKKNEVTEAKLTTIYMLVR
jgi:hypothetical protein